MFSYFLGALALVLGIMNESPLWVNISILIILVDNIIKTIRTNSLTELINPIFLYCGGKVISTYGNLLGMYYADDPIAKWHYWYYANEKYLLDAALIHVFSSYFLLLGYKFLSKQQLRIPQWMILSYQFDPALLRKYDVLILSVVGAIVFKLIPVSGKLVDLVIYLLVFIYAFLSQKEDNKNFYFFRAILITVLITLNAFYTSYLRLGLINPTVMLLVGLFWGRGNISVFKDIKLFPLYLYIVIFAVSFNELSDARSNSDLKFAIFSNTFNNLISIDKWNRTEENDVDENVSDDILMRDKSIFGRMANFNQISKVVEVQEEDGFYYGETLAYLLYAWIPRIVWPDKPEIASGKWFAVKAGLAYVYEDGRVNNSVDMGVGGELFLNFGYLGVIVGCFILGMFWAFLWKLTNFYEGLNLPGVMFGSYLLMLGYSQFGADIQTIITVLSVYFSVLILNQIFNLKS